MEGDKHSLLRSVPLFSGISEKDFTKIKSKFFIKKFKKNEVILEEKDTGNFFYVILNGVVRIVKPLKARHERVLSLQRAGDFFGEMAILDGRTSPARMIACEPVEILFTAKEDFIDIVLNNRNVNIKLIKTLCDRLRESWGKIESLSSLSAEKRICKVLYDISNRHSEIVDEGIKIMMPMSHKEIADMAATSRETVTRTLLSLQHNSIIKKGIKKQLIILDPAKLKALSEGA